MTTKRCKYAVCKSSEHELFPGQFAVVLYDFYDEQEYVSIGYPVTIAEAKFITNFLNYSENEINARRLHSWGYDDTRIDPKDIDDDD